MKLPICITLDLVERVEDLWFYEMVLAVPPSEASVTIALLETNLDGDADVSHLKRNGLPALSETSLRDLLIRLFRLAYSVMMDEGGSAIQWSIPDVSEFLNLQFTASVAAEYAYVLGTFVDVNFVPSKIAIVRID